MNNPESNSVAQSQPVNHPEQSSISQPVSSENRPVSGDTSEKKQRENNNKIYTIIAVILFILIVGELGFVFVFHNTSFKQLLPLKSNNQKNVSPSSFPPTVTEVPSNIVVPVPTGQQNIVGTGAASGFTLRLEKIVEKPTITGDKPLKNLEYVAFAVSVTNNTSQTSLVPGMFYFQDAGTGKLFMPANIFGHVQAYNWIVPTFSQKNVRIPNKSSLTTTKIPAGKTVNNLYLIYQIIPGETGKLVWNTADTIKEITFGQTVSSTKIINYYGENKIFELDATNNEANKIGVFLFPTRSIN